jgi:hypothetical protein
MKTKKPGYKGELKKPIYIGSIPIEGANEVLPKWIERELLEKLPHLMQHYKIADKNDYFSLALALAMDHVEGFQVKRAALKLKHGNWGAVMRESIGRPTIWPPERLLKLLKAVEDIKNKNSISDHEALSRLALRGEWLRPANQHQEQWLKTLKNRLAEARRLSAYSSPKRSPGK